MYTTIDYKEFHLVVRFYELNVHIEDSYQVTKRADMLEILKLIRKKSSIEYKRTNDSWIREWRAHNLLYINKYKVQQTKSVDLNEDETVGKRFIYAILSAFYQG